MVVTHLIRPAITQGTLAVREVPGTVPKGKRRKEPSANLLVSMGLGITFGAFAGAGFYAVKIGADRLLPAGAQEEIVSENQQSLPANAGSLANVSQVTYVSGDISGVVEQVMPAMVSIVNNYTRTTSFWVIPTRRPSGRRLGHYHRGERDGASDCYQQPCG